LPDPLPPLDTANHATELVAVQEHADGAVTVTVPDDGSDPDATELGEIEISQVPACATVRVRPATVSVPVLGAGDALAPTTYVTAPFPPLLGPAPELIEIHDVLLEADQTQPVGIVTLAMPLPPVASNDSVVDDRLAVHGAPSCVIVRSCPAMPIEPTRLVPLGFASTV
jgi:hypothetical protein